MLAFWQKKSEVILWLERGSSLICFFTLLSWVSSLRKACKFSRLLLFSSSLLVFKFLKDTLRSLSWSLVFINCCCRRRLKVVFKNQLGDYLLFFRTNLSLTYSWCHFILESDTSESSNEGEVSFETYFIY